VLDGSTGFAVNDTILVTADILVLSEQTQFVRENELVSASSNASAEVLSGKFTWKVGATVYPLFGSYKPHPPHVSPEPEVRY